jgi:hypothetical protein
MRGVANTVDCTVIAIARDMGPWSKWTMVMPGDSLRQLYQLRDDLMGAIQLHVKGPYVGRLAPIAARLRHDLAKAGYRVMDGEARPFWMKLETVTGEDWTGQKLDVSTWEDEQSFMTWTLRAFDNVSFVLLLILVAIVVTGIMNTLWIAIGERTREIGTLRAIGTQRSSVVRMFVLEATLLGLAGALAGVASGSMATVLINHARIHVPRSAQLFVMSDTIRLSLDAGALFGAVLSISIVTGTAALFPSLRAVRLRPMDAMFHFN